MAKGSHGGSLGSWLAVVVMWIGFAAGGIALVLGPTWWLFWTGVGIVVVGGILALAVGIFDDVIVDAPRVLPEEMLGRQGLRGGPYEDTSDRRIATDPATQKPHG